MRHCNVVILEYLLSHFSPQNRVNWANQLFDGLLENVLQNRLDNSPFLFLINDIDHFEVRNCFDILLQKLQAKGYRCSCKRRHFCNRSKDFEDGSKQYSSQNNKFVIPKEIKGPFNCAIYCTGAQLIVEVQ